MEEGKDAPSKKRVAGREISRDNPGLDDDDGPEPEMGTFKRAPDEVIAGRRIIKVRRQQPPAPSSSNPFAKLNLFAPVKANDETNKPVEKNGLDDAKAPLEGQDTAIYEQNTTENGASVDEENSAKDNNQEVKSSTSSTLQEDTENHENVAVQEVRTKEKIDEVHDEIQECQGGDLDEGENKGIKIEEGEDRKEDAKEDDEVTKESEKEPTAIAEKHKIEQKSTSEPTARLSSFQQLSSNQNAFTGFAGTGFSDASFSFGSLLKDGSALDVGSGSLFGSQIEKSQKLLGGDISDNTKAVGSSAPTMQEVSVETGEENEKVVFKADAILFEYIAGSWKERGKGELKVNVSTLETEKARLVMRAKGNYRLILNSSLYADMSVKEMDKRGVTFACINSAGEGKEGLTTFGVKFRETSVAQEFRETVTAYKGKRTSSSLKTPENSPKATDD